ncbi:shikimate kinase [Celeribacter marinus]|uniref:shikimate kinase n=1 Tax=Celeribacter marinus TaxID=1397108 RepID=UPI003F6C18D6
MALGLKKTVALVGMMGAGKTAVGKALALKCGVDFLDSDAEIEKAANCSIAEIFSDYGEAFFRDKETLVISRLLDTKQVVLSTGGGAFLSGTNRDMISQKGVAVWLKADVDILWNRVRHKNTRPLLRTANPYETLTDLVTSRTPLYEKAGVIVTAEPSLSIEGMADKVIDALRAYGGILDEDLDEDTVTEDATSDPLIAVEAKE